MAELSLNVEERKEVGKKATKQLRYTGKIPGIYYIHGEDSVPVAVDEKSLREILQSESSIIDLNFGKNKNTKCVIREIQWDPVYNAPLHVDFMGIKLTEKITVEVPVHLVGTPVGVKQEGGILQHIIREIEVECLPLDIPEHLEVDVSELEIGDAIRVEDIVIEKVTILNEPNQTIAVVRPPTVIAEPTEEVEEAAEPELIGEEKEETEEESGEKESE